MSLAQDLFDGHDFQLRCTQIFQRGMLVHQVCLQNLNKPYTTLASQLIYLLHPFLHFTQFILNCVYLSYSTLLLIANLMLLSPNRSINRLFDNMHLSAAIFLEFSCVILSCLSNISRTCYTVANGVYSLPKTETDDITLTFIQGSMKAANLKSLDGKYLRESGQNKTSLLLKEELRYHEQVLRFL